MTHRTKGCIIDNILTETTCMKVEIKVLFDTDEPKDERLIQQVIDIVEELKERLDD